MVRCLFLRLRARAAKAIWPHSAFVENVWPSRRVLCKVLCRRCAGVVRAFSGAGALSVGFGVGLAALRASPPPRIIKNIDLHSVRGGGGRASPTTKIIQNLLTFILFEEGMGRASASPTLYDHRNFLNFHSFRGRVREDEWFHHPQNH